MIFYDKDEDGSSTPQYISLAKQVSEGVLKKAKNNKNAMTFRVGAVNCHSGEATRFCQRKLGLEVELPVFATVINGSLKIISDANTLRNAKNMHDHTADALLKIEGLVVNVNNMQHIKSRMLSTSPTPGHPSIAIVLFTDKYETSSLYASLAYRHRHDGFAAFGESRGSNAQLGKQFGVEKYPTLVALVGSEKTVEKYPGKSLDLESLSNWVTSVKNKHFKSQSSGSDNRKRSRA